jgi:hypothetical protein
MAAMAALLLVKMRLVSISWGSDMSINNSTFGWRSSYLVHETEDDISVVLKSTGEFTPENSELSSGSSLRIRRVSDDATRGWLLGWVIVPHVVMRIQDRISSFCFCNIIDSIGEVTIVLNKVST